MSTLQEKRSGAKGSDGRKVVRTIASGEEVKNDVVGSGERKEADRKKRKEITPSKG